MFAFCLGALGCGRGPVEPPCTSDAECSASSQVCTQGVCTCASDRCPSRMECSSETAAGRCFAVLCGLRTACQDPGDVCDAFHHQCRPLTGACAQVGDCPTFDERVSSNAALSCTLGSCRLGTRELLPPPGLTASSSIAVGSPLPGQGLTDGVASLLSWTAPLDAGSIAIVLRGFPTDQGDFARRAVWGISRTRFEPSHAAWSEGTAIVAGHWGGPAPEPPANEPLYLFVEAVREATLVAASALVPFRFGAGFPQPGSPCDDEGVFPGSCLGPLLPLVCRNGACAILCASHDDCIPHSTNHTLQCGLPFAGAGADRPDLRACE